MARPGLTLMPVRSSASFAGAAAAAVSLGLSELLGGVVAGVPSLVESVGDLVIDTVPPPVKDFAISVFGVYDKPVLVVGIVLVTLALGAVMGSLARRRFWVAILGFAGFAALAALAGARDPESGLQPAAMAASLSALAGVWALSWLLRGSTATTLPGRRAFLRSAGSVVALALLAGSAGRLLLERTKAIAAGRGEVLLPEAVEPVPPPSPAASLTVEGITPIVVPNDDFYRIDTALSIPQVDLDSWRLHITGMVDREVELSYADLVEMPMVERYITICCVSNEVGGDLVGNAKWLGVPLRKVLDLAGVRPEAEQLVGRSVDRFTVGFPVEAAYDGREALLAVGMNGEPLPLLHGFPARLVVSGLYGYVSATKWLGEIHLTSWDGFDAYWIPRGWEKEAPVKTQSRIDVPVRGSVIPAGSRMIAGVAWAPHRGISRVEVQVDEGAWTEAELSQPLSNDAWRQWAVPFVFTPGNHRIRVRAADGTGAVQPEELSRPAPDGATGWHTIFVAAE
jgi:DMSO/TMAO reductase YedYZ molybdopterin-dependent catalytic subunit